MVGENSASQFATTHWSVVLKAGDASSVDSAAALEALCGSYWRPLYVFARRRGKDRHEAEDLVQGFLAHFVEKGALGAADPDRGRFRSFLRKSFDRYIQSDWVKAHALKRGGGSFFVALEDVLPGDEEALCGASDGRSESAVYDRQWAVEVFSEAIRRLESRYVASEKAVIFRELRPLLDQPVDHDRYRAVAARLEIEPNAVSVRLHRLRREFREALRSEIERTVENPEDVEGELAYLKEVLLSA
ncbi:MAG: sigma-70 family RNA polymerase sigma factor [Limisphaerales bacterium]